MRSVITAGWKRKPDEGGSKEDQLHLRFFFEAEDAISESIGALLMTVIMATAVAMVAIALFSGVSTTETPALVVGLLEGESDIALIHQGGDPLYRATTQILVDGTDRTDDFKTPEGDDWTTFSVGDILVSSIPCTGDEVIRLIYTASENPTVIQTLYTRPGPPAPVANFTFSPESGYISQMFSFTDLSTGGPTSWLWDFGDGNMSMDSDPTHSYNYPGNYEITLTSCNDGRCSSITRNVTVFGFSDFITNESVFVYGTKIKLSGGNHVVGKNSTIILLGDIVSRDLSGGTIVSVTNIYVNGSLGIGGGDALGDETTRGLIYINGDLEVGDGSRVYGDEIYVNGKVDLNSNIYGDLYSNSGLDFNNGNIYGETHIIGDLSLINGNVHENIYLDGDLTLGNTPSIDTGAYIYYTGSLIPTPPSWYPQNILDKCIHVGSVPGYSTPEFLDIPIPPAKLPSWYFSNGYVAPNGSLSSGMKIYTENDFSFRDWILGGIAENVVIVSSNGNIEINRGGISVTGVLFAPNGRVTFRGGYFEGLVIARDGFYVESGGTDVEFRNIAFYISDPENYPFENY